MSASTEETKSSVEYINYLANDLSAAKIGDDLDYAIRNRSTLKQFLNDDKNHIEDIDYIKAYRGMTLVYLDIDILCIDATLYEVTQAFNDYGMQHYKKIFFLKMPNYNMFLNTENVENITYYYVKFNMATIPFHPKCTMKDVDRLKNGIEMLNGR